MKIRRGLVSNSSSSSFVCNVCGQSESGWDASPSDFGWSRCVNGHVLCPEDASVHLKEDINVTIEEEIERELSEEEQDALDYEGADLLEKDCPVCQFLVLATDELAAFLLKEYKVPREQVFEEVKKINKRRKKLYDSEYIAAVAREKNLDILTLPEELRKRFNSYRDFMTYIRS